MKVANHMHTSLAYRKLAKPAPVRAKAFIKIPAVQKSQRALVPRCRHQQRIPCEQRRNTKGQRDLSV